MKYDFSNLTLLYIEDDKTIRESAVFYLQRVFLRVFYAENGIRGLEIYREYKPNIIIADIKMPKLNGLEFTRIVRSEDISIPIIITTAFSDNNLLLEAVNLQITNYLIKPINPNSLHLALAIAYEQLYIDKIIYITKYIKYDIRSKKIISNEDIINLTKKELLLLELLVKNSKRVVTYSEIENSIWVDSVMSIDSLRSLIRTLRKKIKGIKIKNLSGVGYSIEIH